MSTSEKSIIEKGKEGVITYSNVKIEIMDYEGIKSFKVMHPDDVYIEKNYIVVDDKNGTKMYTGCDYITFEIKTLDGKKTLRKIEGNAEP